MKRLNLATLVLVASIQALPAMAAGKLDLIGGTIKNKKTNEHLGLACATRDANEICTHYQFVMGDLKKSGDMEIRALVGSSFSYDTVRSRMTNSAIPDQFENRDYVDLQPLTGTIAGGFTGGSIAMWGTISYNWSDYSVAGKIWRVVLAGLATPILVAADVTMYTGAGVVDGVRYAAAGTYVGAENLVAHMKMAKAHRKTLRGLKVIASPEKEGRVVRVSNDLFEEILNSIEGAI